ncbi:MAG: hypothetical protein M0D53_01745 [Flavobacterium sp. JAD_PAG50586_2]|nr:MAG: hypothetical protein M0D53_01745 [Flavobacterium sp. JAD_PAG50586_2]
MKSKILLLLSLLFINYTNSQNLIANPGFELGSSGVGFVTNGAGYTQLTAPYTGTSVPGNFAVVNNPKLINTTNYISEGDHTTGTGNMLVIDGSTNTTSPRFWRAGDTGSGVTGLNIGTIYFFSYWIKSVSNLGNPANISLSVTGGTAPVLLSGTATAPAPAQSWRQVVYSFTATATSATIELWNTNTIASGVGNDFAVDDFMLTDDLIISYNVTNAVCSVGNNGSVTVSAFGGTPPYVNYNITGPGATNVNNLTGVFSGLQPGVYTVSVTDSSLPTAITTTLTNVVVGPTITIFTSNSNTAIACAGSPITLTASGSTASYSWTASPTDPTLTTPLIANPIVTPTVPTTYTVTSTIGSCAQISRSVQVGINPLPTASISGTTTLCNGSTTLITFTGTPNATVTYKINGGANLTIVLDAAGNATLTTPAITSQAVYSLVSVTSAGPPFCTQTVVGSVKISVDIQLGVTANPNPICVGGTSALRATGFTFSTASGVPLNPMVGATNILSSGNDNNPSSATNIGFNFNFGGIDYTQFSVSPDGWLLLGGAVAVSQPNNVTTNVQNTPKLYPFWDDLATGSNGSVNVLVTGTAPNRIFIIEWNVTIPKNVAGAANSTFQMWLYETTNVIEYHYGTMGVQTSNSISGGYTVSAANYSSITFNSNSASTSVPNDANTTTPSSGTTYTYAPLSSLIWSPTTNLFNDAAATIAYTGDSRAVVYATNVPDAGATYLVTGANGAGCTATANINIVVSKPVVTSPNPSATVTICPGNTASFTIVGTAFSTVTFTNPTVTPATGPINIPLTGSVVFTTPILNESVVYTLTEIRSFLTGCTTAPLNITLTVNVVPNGCATVGTVPAPGTRPLDLTLCTPGECRTLQADVSPVPSTTSYSVASIPYCPQAAFENPTWNNILPGGPIGDDDWSAPFSFPAGMNFCFYGQNYTQLNVGTNQVIHFPNPALFAAGDFCPWQYNQTIPSTTFPITNAIFGVYQDTDFSVTPPPGTQISVNYNVIGTYPCRKFIANFTNCPQFSCGNTIGLSTSQIVLYEVSNIIEVYVQRRVACTGWNNGNGTIGVIDGTGAQGVAAPGRNAAPFSTDPTPTNPTNSDNVSEAWRFTPTGPPVSQTINWYEGPVSAGNQIGTGPTIQVCPTVTTTYTLQTVFNVCGVPQTATTTQTLNVTPDLTGTPVDITRCTNIFDLTVNDGIILGSLNPLDYEISYHTSAVEANTGSNPIANPAAYSPGINFGTYPVWACIYLNSSNCRVVKPFDLIYDNCSVVVEDVPDLVLCDDSSADGSTTFNLTSQTAIALGTNSPTDYTITYHTSLTDANDDINPISPISGYNNTSNPQTIWIRMEENIAPTQYATETFTLTVKPLPTATISGTRTVCKDDASPNITFTGADGTAPYTFVYSTDGGATTITTGPSTGNTLTIPVSTATAGVFTYTLISVEDSGPPACSQNQSGTATVTVNPLPTATISGTISVCKDAPSPNITFTGANGTAPYTFVYSTDGEQPP